MMTEINVKHEILTESWDIPKQDGIIGKMESEGWGLMNIQGGHHRVDTTNHIGFDWFLGSKLTFRKWVPCISE